MTPAAWWLVRHAAPQVAPGTCYGALDVPADPQASQQAALRLAEALPRGTLMSHSPLQRCEQLAHYLIALRPDLASNPDPRLREMDFGDWEGRPWADIARGEIDAWTQSFAHYRPGAGENLHSMLARVDAARREALKALQQGHPVAWITHAGVTRCVAWLSSHGGKLPLSHQWPLEAPGWGDWVMVRPGLTGEAPAQQT